MILALGPTGGDVTYAASSWTIGAVIFGVLFIAAGIGAVKSRSRKGRFSGIAVVSCLVAVGLVLAHLHK